MVTTSAHPENVMLTIENTDEDLTPELAEQHSQPRRRARAGTNPRLDRRVART
jgi:hypothetical protein